MSTRDEIQEDTKRAENEYWELQDYIKKAKREFNELTDATKKEKIELDEVTDAMKKAKIEYRDLQDDAEKLKKQIEDLETEKRQKQEEFNHEQYKEAKQYANKEITEEGILAIINRRIQDAESKLAEIRKEKDDLEKTKQANNEMFQVKAKKSVDTDLLLSLREMQIRDREQKADINSSLQLIDKSARDKKAEELAELEQSIKEKEEKLNSKQANITDREDEISKREEEFKQREEESKKREEGLKQREEELKQKEEELKKREEEVAKAKEQLNEKDSRIKEQETTIEQQSALIAFDENVINMLINKINSLHKLVSKSKETFTQLFEKVGHIVNKTEDLEKRLQDEENRSVFSMISQKIKSTFSKQPLLPASNDCNEIYSDSKELSDSASTAKIEMQEYNETTSINEMKKMLQVRQNKKMDINDRESDVEFKSPEAKRKDEIDV